MYEIKIKVLTEKEHEEYVHLCGLKGKVVDADMSWCERCIEVEYDKYLECSSDHAVEITGSLLVGQIIVAALAGVKGECREHAIETVRQWMSLDDDPDHEPPECKGPTKQ